MSVTILARSKVLDEISNLLAAFSKILDVFLTALRYFRKRILNHSDANNVYLLEL